MTGWQIFSTNGAHGLAIHKRCIDSWHGYYDEMFCWLNGTVCSRELRDYIIGKSSVCIVSDKTYTRIPWGKYIREIPLRVAYLLERVGKVPFKPGDYIMHFDSDVHMPVHPDFPAYFDAWTASDSPAMLCNFVYPWGDHDVIRVDPFASQLSHGFFFRVTSEFFTWLPYRGRGCPRSIRPKDCWECPYPVLHYNHFTKQVREDYLAHKRDAAKTLSLPDEKRPTHYQIDPPRIVLAPFKPNMTMEDIFLMQRDIAENRLPNGCLEEVLEE